MRISTFLGLALLMGSATGIDAQSSLSSSGGMVSSPAPIQLSNDLPTGHQAASANAAVTTYSVLAYGAVHDALTVGNGSPPFATVVSRSNIISVPGAAFTSADIGKYIVLQAAPSQPFSTTPSIAQIIAPFIDSTHVHMSKTAVVSEAISQIGYGTDNQPAFDACSSAVLASTSGRGTCAIPAGAYFFATAPYYVLTGAEDNGSYGQPAGGSGAIVTVSLSGGTIASCSVGNPGSLYTPSAIMQTHLDGGCGSQNFAGGFRGGTIQSTQSGKCGSAYVTVATNSSGRVASCSVVNAGFGFSTPPTVTVLPLGGDGAAATATISAGSVVSTAITAGGGGYPSSGTDVVDVWGVGGTGCAAITTNAGASVPAVITFSGKANTNSSGQVSSIDIVNAGSGCSGAPTLIFGDYLCGASLNQQCTNLAPINPTRVPVSILMVSGVNWQGVSGAYTSAAKLTGIWDDRSVDTNEPAIFGGYMSNTDITGIEMNNTYWSILATNNVAFSTIKDVQCGQITANCLFTGAMDFGSSVLNLSSYGFSPWVNGGTWCQRIDFPSTCGGFNNALQASSIITHSIPYTSAPSLMSAIDDFFANYFWHPEYSAKSVDFFETAKFPQPPNQRQTSHSITDGHQANSHTYRGITSTGMNALERAQNGSDTFYPTNVVMKFGSRHIFCCALGAQGSIQNIGCEGCVPLTGTSDPYRNSTTLESGVLFTHGYLVSTVNWVNNGSVLQPIWGIGAGTAGRPSSNWTNLVCADCTSTPPYMNGDSYAGAPGSSVYFRNINAGSVTASQIIPGIIYSAAGTALPKCDARLRGTDATVSDATAPTYLGAYVSGGTVVSAVLCNGSAWVTH